MIYPTISIGRSQLTRHRLPRLRVLVVSDSILNAPSTWEAQFAALTGLPTSEIDVCVRSYGGAQSPIGMAQLATDVAAWGQSGNLLRNSNLDAWPIQNATKAVENNPITGTPALRVTGTGVSSPTQQVFTSFGTGTHAVVPSGATELTFSIEITRGTFNSFELHLQNNTTSGTILRQTIRQEYMGLHVAGSLPVRYALTARSTDGVGFASGNRIVCIIALGNSDGPLAATAWLADPLLNVGVWPLRYAATSGTAQTPATAAWVVPTRAIDYSLFDLVAVCFANDASATPAASYEAIFESMAAGAVTLGGQRVLLVTPPPKANVDLLDWDATQTWATNLRAAFLSAASGAGVPSYDAWTDFQARTSSGANTVAQLMRDVTHPTADVGDAGHIAYAEAMINAARGGRQSAIAGATPFARFGFEAMTGGWAMIWLTQDTTSPNNDMSSIATAFSTNRINRAATSTGAGTLTITTPACEHIGLLHLVHPTAGGEVDVSIDGGAATRINTTVAGAASNYGRGTFIAGGLARTAHTVTIDWVSGTPAVVGVSGC